MTKDLAKGTVKIASKAVDAVADVSKDLAKGTVKIASKAVDAVADTAGKVYDFVKFW